MSNFKDPNKGRRRTLRHNDMDDIHEWYVGNNTNREVSGSGFGIFAGFLLLVTYLTYDVSHTIAACCFIAALICALIAYSKS